MWKSYKPGDKAQFSNLVGGRQVEVIRTARGGNVVVFRYLDSGEQSSTYSRELLPLR